MLSRVLPWVQPQNRIDSRNRTHAHTRDCGDHVEATLVPKLFLLHISCVFKPYVASKTILRRNSEISCTLVTPAQSKTTSSCPRVVIKVDGVGSNSNIVGSEITQIDQGESKYTAQSVIHSIVGRHSCSDEPTNWWLGSVRSHAKGN